MFRAAELWICDRFNVPFSKVHCLLLYYALLFASFIFSYLLSILFIFSGHQFSFSFCYISIYNLRNIFSGEIFQIFQARHFYHICRVFSTSQWEVSKNKMRKKKQRKLKIPMNGNKRYKMYKTNVSDFLVMHWIWMERCLHVVMISVILHLFRIL